MAGLHTQDRKSPNKWDDSPQHAAIGEGTGSLEKALDVLDLVGAAAHGLGRAAITERLGIPRTTSYRLLATLVARGLLRRDPLRKVYRLGFRCFEMARQAYPAPDLVAACVGEMRTLRDLTGETCYLAVLDGLDVLSLERCDGAHSHRSSADLGQRKPAYCTSQGKSILSALAPSVRDALIREMVLKPLTPLTITDRKRLQAELKICGARGYAIDDEEILLGVRCVGAPVVDGRGQVRGAISIAGPAYRMTRARLELLGPEVAEAAARAGAQLPLASQQQDDTAVRPLDGPWSFHGAHLLWNSQYQRLVWADTLAPSVRAWEDGHNKLVINLDAPIVGIVTCGDELCIAHGQGALALSADGTSRPLANWPKKGLQAVCNGEDGVLWAAMTTIDGGSVVGQLRDDGQMAVQWRSKEQLQCLRWRREDQSLYATAPESGAILRMQEGTRVVRRLASVLKGSGQVSGLAFDARDGVWTCLNNGWSVVRFSMDGVLDRVIGLPVPCPTDLAFGGPAGDRLYVTTARHSVPLDALGNAPLSGRLFELTI